MDYTVLDLEFNNMQGLYENIPDYLDKDKRSLRYLYPNEIIQIGAVRTDENFNIKDRLNLFVKNRFYKNLNPAISEMTGVTQDQLDSGIEYEKAVKKLVDFSKDSILVTWGISDIYEILRNCHMYSMPITIVGKKYLDLQGYLSEVTEDSRVFSLKNAMLFFELSHDDEHFHDGLYDSECTAYVLRETVKKYGPLKGFKSSRMLFSSESIVISNLKIKDIPDEEITVGCPLCENRISYDLAMSNEHGKVRSMYHCSHCASYYVEEVTANENMSGKRKYFKKIKKVPKDYFYLLLSQKQKQERY